MTKKRFLTACLLAVSIFQAYSQTGVLRGFVYEATTGEPVISAFVTFQGVRMGAYTDEKGFYNVSNLPAGTYAAYSTLQGYDTSFAQVVIKTDIVAQNFYISATSKELKGVSVSAEKLRKSKEINISQTRINPVQLTRIPSVGGEPDLVQYLQVLPGVVFSGDQGGQLYIRGGSPVMNRVMLDGLTIYNPFHSIGLFSVFDSDILQSVDVYSAGFSSEYGGRISAIVDVKTRDGNKTAFHGKINSSPFNSKILLEGPLKKYEVGKSSSSFILSYKNSYLNKSAPLVYPFVNDGILPYSFSDLYAKIGFQSATGSNVDFFGFDYTDKVDFEESSSYAWKSRGLGTKFLLVPLNSKTIIDGSITYSNYFIEQKEIDDQPRSSGINGYSVNLNFSRFFNGLDKLKYGLEMNGFRTEFQIYNSSNRRITQYENTSEINAFVNYLKNINKKLLLEGGLRLQRYASLSETTLEPRLRMKYNFNTRWRFKASAGLYSQNLMSAVSDRDVVNLFYGFLSGPDDLPKTFLGKPVESKLQKARHAVAGFEFDINSISEINVEGYIKDFTQLTNVNRDKIFDDVPENVNRPRYLVENYIVEEGEAYGYDITYKLENKHWYIWTVYSFNIVNRYYEKEERIKYSTHFDRRHNVNIVNSYDFGKELAWTANVRWNFGSGFPFTLTQGFYEALDLSQGASTDITAENGELGIYYDDLNKGRLPYYHRLDASIKRKFKIKTKKENVFNKAEVIFSVTNIYNRENIFYFDRVNYKRENQLPFLPSLSASFSF
ncbi:MAG: hypothetical protein ACJAR8_001503 [Bacteroidia bacterium]|jgi:hypothetical protein